MRRQNKVLPLKTAHFIARRVRSCIALAGIILTLMTACRNPFYPSLGATKLWYVRFNSNGGTAVVTQTVRDGETAVRPASPVRSGYTFENWYSDASLALVYNFSAPVIKNITLHARWLDPFTGTADFAAYLAELPPNTPGNPYTIALNVDNAYSLQSIMHANLSTYVVLDLSGSSFSVVDDDTFISCSNLTGITLPAGLTTIKGGAFEQCSNLISINIPNSVISIENAFAGCTSLTSITLPASLVSINSGALADCSSLIAIHVNPANAQFSSDGGILYNKNKTALLAYPAGKTGTFSIPSGVTAIGDSAFEGSGLTSLIIPGGVTSIGDLSFSGSRLTSLTIPNGVISIEYGTFYGCGYLVSITLPNSIASIGDYVFESCPSLTRVRFEGTIPANDFSVNSRISGDLRTKYLTGGPGTYEITVPGANPTWERTGP